MAASVMSWDRETERERVCENAEEQVSNPLASSSHHSMSHPPPALSPAGCSLESRVCVSVVCVSRSGVYPARQAQ